MEKSSIFLSRIFLVFILWQSEQVFANELPSWITLNSQVLSSHYCQRAFTVSSFPRPGHAISRIQFNPIQGSERPGGHPL